MENKIQVRNQGLQATHPILPTKIIKEQDNKAIQIEIIKLLERLVILYQIPNWSSDNGIVLSEWVIETYKYDEFESIKKCLSNPPHTEEKTFRLTPDTISEWMAITLEKEAEKKEIEFSKQKNKSVSFEVPNDNELSEETKKMIQDYINSLSDFKKVPSFSDEDIKKYGKEKIKPKAKSTGHGFTQREDLIMKELRRRWAIECFDLHTGKPNENWMSFEEWNML